MIMYDYICIVRVNRYIKIYKDIYKDNELLTAIYNSSYLILYPSSSYFILSQTKYNIYNKVITNFNYIYYKYK